MTDLEAAFLFHWRLLAPGAPEAVREHRFSKRLYRFDFAWPGPMVAVEMMGGIWLTTKTGRSAGHAHPVRLGKDYLKVNLAQSLGWQVYQCTSGMLEDDPAAFVEMVLKTIKETGK